MLTTSVTVAGKGPSAIVTCLERFSKWNRAVSVLVLLLKSIRRWKGQESISPVEARQQVEKAIVKAVQQEAFHEDLALLNQPSTGTGKNLIPKSSALFRLDPFVDPEGMLRVGGRLRHSTFPRDLKHPLILPKKSHVTKLLIDACHEEVAHQGRGFTMNHIRSKGYWIIGCSTAVSSFLHHCVTCRRLRGKTQGQKMADLPDDRVQSASPFTYVGMDCFGPFLVKEGRKEVKRYGAIFTCLSLRAIHIEVIEEMTTDAFLNCLRCFIAIRGNVRHIRCDQGSNFVGANNELQSELKKLPEGKLKDVLMKHHCDFVFNTPASSHMGGVWERQIGTVKKVLSGLLVKAESRLNTSSLRTLLYEVMAIVNSRPLTTENLSDPAGPSPLTPNMLLTMKSDIVLQPPGTFVKEDLYAKKRWRQVQYLADQFWKRWRLEYLQGQQQRQKWLDQKPDSCSLSGSR